MSVTFSQSGPAGVITLDRAPANSYDLPFMEEFAAAVDEAIGAGVGAVIVRSALGKFFCGGADIKRFLDSDTAENVAMIEVSQGAFLRMAAAPAVFIAHIAGHAMGGGLEIALACDLRYASEGSFRLGTPEVNLGLLPGNGGTQRIARLLGPGRGLEFLLSGRAVTVDEALALGLLSAVFPADEADAKVREIAGRYASGPLVAHGHIKRCVYEGLQLSLEDGLALERTLVAELFETSDAREGLVAFSEKRKPVFTGG
jgi:enoyl-CoA hydratase/carnithine racemase